MTAAPSIPAALHYDGAPRPITEQEAHDISLAEYRLTSRHGQHYVSSRGADGGYHLRETFTRSQAAVTWMNVRRQDLKARILAGDAQYIIFYDSARDTFYCG